MIAKNCMAYNQILEQRLVLVNKAFVGNVFYNYINLTMF